ncbi:MAG TPA: hypothetical protein VK459_19000 [Polyangiaceae bacterium]|nr:hypothetical protein [Polyangiaceae bacterium]
MNLPAIGMIGRALREDLQAPVHPAAFAWFRRFFLGKLLFLDLVSLADSGRFAELALVRVGAVGAGLALTETRRGALIGASLILVIKLIELASAFPYTINHAYFDVALLLLLALGAPPQGGGLHPLRAAQAGIVAVFFGAGIQKLMHGYYIDGQLLALRALYDEGGMGIRLRRLLSLVSDLLHLPSPPARALPKPSFITEAPVTLPGWVWSALCVISNGTWIAEVGLPMAALSSAKRRWTVFGLIGLEGVILILSGEVSFGFTVVACLLSFFPRQARWTHPLGFLVLGISAVLL